MNAKIDMYTPEEVAKSVGVTSATICNWCREGLINSNNVSDGIDRNRYEICEDELRYLRRLARQYGPKKVLLYYKKTWKEDGESTIPVQIIDPDKEYGALTMATYIGVDKTTINKWCREDRIHHRSEKSHHGKGFIHFIPGWEILYIKKIFDKYGKADGKLSPMVLYYKKDVSKRGIKIMEKGGAGIQWVVDIDTEVPEPKVVEETAAKKELEKADKEAKKILDEIGGVKSFTEPSDDKLLDDFIRLRELKRDIEKYETTLNQMKNEYEELKKEVTEWL